MERFWKFSVRFTRVVLRSSHMQHFHLLNLVGGHFVVPAYLGDSFQACRQCEALPFARFEGQLMIKVLLHSHIHVPQVLRTILELTMGEPLWCVTGVYMGMYV